MRHLLLCALCLLAVIGARCEEKIFATYFDIKAGSAAGTEVTGRIHLESNKDAFKSPIPKSYRFEIVGQDNNLFRVETRYDLYGRLMGVIVADKAIPKRIGDVQSVSFVLKDGSKIINEFSAKINIVDKTLWQTLYERYKDYTVTGAGGRMYGRLKPTDSEVAATIGQLEQNGGRFESFGCYTKHPEEYRATAYVDPKDDHKSSGTIEYEWEAVANKIGGLGYAYATSKVYGSSGDSAKRERLKRAMYSAILAYTACVPIEGADVKIEGKPVGDCTGDGFVNLKLHNLIGIQVATHQWVIADGLLAPMVCLIPDILKDIKGGDKQAERVYNSVVQFFQVYTSIVKNRRAIDNPSERWGEIQDTLRSSGAWADANLGHRSRFMMSMPIVWADYNRPMTYVQYWYSDFYNDKPFKGFSFSPGWSPHGVVPDVARWLTKFDTPAREYAQSGFQPDGTVSHHIGNGTDAAMVAYGFEWLTDCFVGFKQFKDTDFKIDDRYYQFPADRLAGLYPKLIYNGRFDFLVAGRSYLNDLGKFITNTYLKAIEELNASKSRDTKLTNQAELDRVYREIKGKTHQYSGTDAYWVNEFLVHRRGENEKPYYASVKLKSARTVGIEDFDKVRKSWHGGYGIMPVKVSGDEYSHKVLSNYDWHTLPGLTEEWRTDALPSGGGAQASLPGDNTVAGVTADGVSGVAIYHHLPREKYSSATGYKTYHFVGDRAMSLGSGIKRLRPGQGEQIVTCIDQSALNAPLTISVNGSSETIQPTEYVVIEREISSPCWLHTADKGYLIIPSGSQRLLVKTGNRVNTTDRRIADDKPNYIIAINHGVNPAQDITDDYCYYVVPNVTAADMPKVASELGKIDVRRNSGMAHAIYSPADKTYQAAFFKAGSIDVGGITICAEQPTLVILRDTGGEWVLTMSNPEPNIKTQELKITISIPLAPGRYDYTQRGIYPRSGESVTISPSGKGSLIVAQLADERDEKKYNYQATLYNAAPVVVCIPK